MHFWSLSIASWMIVRGRSLPPSWVRTSTSHEHGRAGISFWTTRKDTDHSANCSRRTLTCLAITGSTCRMAHASLTEFDAAFFGHDKGLRPSHFLKTSAANNFSSRLNF